MRIVAAMEKRLKMFTLNSKIEQIGLEKVVKGPLFKLLFLLILAETCFCLNAREKGKFNTSTYYTIHIKS